MIEVVTDKEDKLKRTTEALRETVKSIFTANFHYRVDVSFGEPS
jgi:hypothetical protein